MGWWLGLHQPPWSFGFDSQTRGTRENRAPPCVNVRGSSRVPGLRINLNVIAAPLYAPSRAPLRLPLLLSHNLPTPSVH